MLSEPRLKAGPSASERDSSILTAVLGRRRQRRPAGRTRERWSRWTSYPSACRLSATRAPRRQHRSQSRPCRRRRGSMRRRPVRKCECKRQAKGMRWGRETLQPTVSCSVCGLPTCNALDSTPLASTKPLMPPPTVRGTKISLLAWDRIGFSRLGLGVQFGGLARCRNGHGCGLVARSRLASRMTSIMGVSWSGQSRKPVMFRKVISSAPCS